MTIIYLVNIWGELQLLTMHPLFIIRTEGGRSPPKFVVGLLALNDTL